MIEIVELEPADIGPHLSRLAAEWERLANATGAPLTAVASRGLMTLTALAAGASSAVLAAMHKNEVVGVFGIHITPSHVGNERIARECLFFVFPQFRGAGLRLMRAAEKWSSAHGCDAMVINASRFAGDSDRSGRLFEAVGFEHYETSYIKRVA